MREQLEQRLQELKTEFEAGQKLLADLETKQENLKQTLLRISGAIQVLEEELGGAHDPSSNGAEQPEQAISELAPVASSG
jgi:hypothetical protein